MKEEYTKIYHPSGLEAKVLSSSIQAWLLHGWSDTPFNEETNQLELPLDEGEIKNEQDYS